MKAIILNHANSSVRVVTLPPACELTEDMETYLMEHCHVHLSEVSWMGVPSNEAIPVYYENNEEPTLTL